MTLTLDNFVLALSASGLLPPAEVQSALEQCPPEEREDAQSLAQALVARGKLTVYQARELLAGRTSGLVLGNYVVLDRIGAGGMGLVFKAQHKRMKREVALKTLPPLVVDSPEAVKRFHREVQAAAQLTHPNIVTAYDADEADGVHFLVMQYVEGSDLAHYVRRSGRLGLRKAVDYVLQAARGLHYAHQKGIVHRDIKPGNLLLDTEGVVRVLDMGLARFEQELAEQSVGAESQYELTSTGRVIGTVDYMAPEQTIDAKHVDRRVDIYSLGCTLYFLLSGRSPAPDGSLKAKLDWHEKGPVPSLRDVRPDAPAELDAVFQRMMARNPDERYSTMGEVIADLETCLSHLADVPEPTLPSVNEDGSAAVSALSVSAVSAPRQGVVIPEVVSEPGFSASPPPMQAPSASVAAVAEEPSRSSDTYPSQQRPDATVVEKLVLRSTPGMQKARSKERQAWIVAGSVVGVGLVGGLVLWLVSYLQAGPEAHADWNMEVRQKVVDDVIKGSVTTAYGRRLYSEIMAALETGAGGDWYIGEGLTRDGKPKFVRFRQNAFETRTITDDQARQRGLQPHQLQSIGVPVIDRLQALATLETPSLTLQAGTNGRLTGTVRCAHKTDGIVDDATLEIWRRDAASGRNQLLGMQPLEWSQLAMGTLNVDVALAETIPVDGDELIVLLRGFLYEPAPAMYRVSNQTTYRLIVPAGTPTP